LLCARIRVPFCALMLLNATRAYHSCFILEYGCKMDTMDSDSHSDIYSIQRETNITKFDETNKILVPRSSIAKANQNQIIHLIISEVIVN